MHLGGSNASPLCRKMSRSAQASASHKPICLTAHLQTLRLSRTYEMPRKIYCVPCIPQVSADSGPDSSIWFSEVGKHSMSAADTLVLPVPYKVG